jgi:putative CocE/NonD family hydrolase
MSNNIFSNQKKSNMFYPFAMIIVACLVLSPAVSLAINHLTSQPYETRPSPDGKLAYQIIPTPPMTIEKDVMVTMPDGKKLACNVYRPNIAGQFPVILAMTPYGKDLAPPTFNLDGSVKPGSYAPYIQRVYDHGLDLGHMMISLLTTWEGPDPAFWVPNNYVVIIVDRRGGFKSEGTPPSSTGQGDDIYWMIEWAAIQPWSNGNVGMVGVSALAGNQYYTASHQPPSNHLKAIIPWESSSDGYRDSGFWGGIPETNFTKQALKAAVQALPPVQAAQTWKAGIDPVANQSINRVCL